MAATSPPEALKNFRLSRILWPSLLSVLAVSYLTYKDLQAGGWADIQAFHWTSTLLLWIFFSFCMSAMRDLGYIWRLRMLTDNKISWRSALEVTFLWEFASAITPSVVGGSAVAIFMLIKEKISGGRSTAIVFVTILLDELFYLMILPIAVFLVGHEPLFSVVEYTGSKPIFGTIVTAFWIGYSLIFLYVGFLIFALFIRPEAANYLLKGLFRWRILRKWKRRGIKLADELLASSLEFRQRGWIFWIKVFFATCLAWMGRYLVLNCLTYGFGHPSFFEQMVVFARQAILFLLMIIAPTPGSSGVAEVIFPTLFGQFIPSGMAPILVLLWRLATYYLYLFLGLVIIPRWLKRVFVSDTPVEDVSVSDKITR